jgi:hypothetical protein
LFGELRVGLFSSPTDNGLKTPWEVPMRFPLGLALVIFTLGSAGGFGAARVVIAPPIPAPVGVVRYMDALRRHDGRLIWASYSPALRERRIEEGDSEAATVALFDRFRQDGASIDDVVYVGGYQARESGYYLCVTRHFRAGAAPIEVVWIFQTDPAGLIDRIVVGANGEIRFNPAGQAMPRRPNPCVAAARSRQHA